MVKNQSPGTVASDGGADWMGQFSTLTRSSRNGAMLEAGVEWRRGAGTAGGRRPRRTQVQ